MTRGLITVATGDQHYYRIAANLLLSYRTSSTEPLPFAIIAEEENEFTSLFDIVIITDEAEHSFMDKLLVLKLTPFDETLFFDSDCLAYGDLNEYWKVFESATDFSALGVNVGLYEEGTWYNIEDIWKYGEKITYKVKVHLGMFFVRNNNSITKLYNDIKEIESNYSKLHFLMYEKSRDEAIMGIAMPMNYMRAVPETAHLLGVLPSMVKINANIKHKNLIFTTEWGTHTDHGILLHFGTAQTKRRFYRYEEEQLILSLKQKKTVKDIIRYDIGTRKISLFAEDIFHCFQFVVKKILKIRIH